MNGEYYLDEGDQIAISLWQRLSRLLWVLLLLTMVAVIIGAFLPELRKQRNERDARALLYRQIETQRRLRSRHELEVSWLTNNPEYIETIARDRFDMMKEGETIFRMEDSKAKPAPSSAPAPAPVSPARKPLN